MTSGGVEDDKHHQPPPPFQGVSNYPPPPQQQTPATSYLQPTQPYVAGYVVAGARPTTEHDPLPCCGLGIGWFLFILGFFFVIPWYIGFFLLLFSRNPREKPGYTACTVGAVVATILIVVGAIRG